MASIDTFRKMAMAFPDTIELPHFEKTSFRVNNKIFATLDITNKKAVVKLTEIDQSVFCEYDLAICPVKGSWGKQGWTVVELKKIKKGVLSDLLSSSYALVNKKKPKSPKQKTKK